MAKRVNRDDIDKYHEFGLHLPTRTISFFADVDADSVRALLRNLHILDSASDAPITIQLATDGGDVDAGLAAYDAIRACRSEVTIVCVGSVQSVGTVILQAGDRRAARQHVTIMYHDGTDALPDTPLREAFRSMRHSERVSRRVDEIVLARIREKKPSYSPTTLVNQSLRGIYLFPEEALELGLIDEIAE